MSSAGTANDFEVRNDVGYGGTRWITVSPADQPVVRLQASGAEVVREPTEQPYGVRDCAFRGPAGTLTRIQKLR